MDGAVIVSPLVRSLLEKRGVVDDAEVAAFLSPDYAAHTHDPFLLKDMDVAVARVLAAIDAGERIAIYADFDCDGIPGAGVLHDFFAKVGYDNVEVYIPHRDREGYGFHIEAIDTLAARGVALIITVDVGTVATKACAHAHMIGVDVIVTDHHELLGELPQAVAVINPRRAPYPFPHLCGAATAYKLVQALVREGRMRGRSDFAAIADGWEKWLLDLVAIATVADMMPLMGENRALVYWGLQVLRKSPRLGIRALCAHLRLRQSELTEEDVGFSIAPRMNAASRMDTPELAFRLITTRDRAEAEALAVQLEHLNAQRKGVVAGIVKHARKAVAARYTSDDRVVVLGDPEWKPALLGLAANSIMQDRGGAVFIWGRSGAGVIKGSCRSDGSISIVDIFTRGREIFVECGGHECSGGFSVSSDAVHTLPERLAQIVGGIAGAAEERAVSNTDAHDAQIALREIGWPLLSDIAQLAPFGAENAKPVFRIGAVRVSDVRTFGKEKNHIELQLVEYVGEVQTRLRAYQFFKTASDFTHAAAAGDIVHVLGTIERDSYRNAIALRIIDILPAK